MHAVLAAALALAGQGRAQVLPAGEFSARDGRPGYGQTWKIGDAAGRALAARINQVALATPIVVDYDHQTLHAAAGTRAPAAGWMKRVEWVDGQGLFADIEWTAAAAKLIGDGEYRYFSPVITYSPETGEVTGVLMGALVNLPAIVGMEAVQAALSALAHRTPPTEQPDMNLLAQLLARIGLPADTTEAAALDAVGALKAQADQAAALRAELGVQTGADATAALSAVRALKTAGSASEQTLALVASLNTQVAALQAAAAETEIVRDADQAIAAGKFLPALRDELLALGRKDRAALSSLIAKATPIPGLAGQSTDAAAAAAAAAAGTAALAGELPNEVARRMGIPAKDWAAYKARQAA